TVQHIKLANQTITVKGYAEKMITSDLGTWYGSFYTRADDLTAAYDKLEADGTKVLAWLRQAGVKKDEMEVGCVATKVLYEKTDKGQDTNAVEGYRLSRWVKVSSTDVALISRLARESTGLIKEGVRFGSSSPDYIYTKIDDLKIEMLGLATADARRRAETLAAESGAKVGKLRSARQGVFQITAAYSTEVTGYGRYDTSTIDKTIKAVVTVDYSIE
ncbi:MAG: SIMPL domain-containing protein, partial [Planctomycetes bacterium]|nr:SIMPL domain-containing protein [Planctomycetota bacterium]